MYEFGNLHKIKDEVKVHLVDDQQQKLNTDTCGIFQLCFYVNLFTPLDGSSIIHEETLTKSTIEKLLNEIFSLDKEDNEKKKNSLLRKRKLEKYCELYNICSANNFVYRNCWLSNRCQILMTKK